MRFLAEHHDPIDVDDRIGGPDAVTAGLMAEIIDQTCRRLPPIGRTEKTARIERLLQSGAWTEAALALIDLELRNGSFAGSPMTRANGIARYRASASFRNGSMRRSKPITRIWRWRSSTPSSTPNATAPR